MLIVGVVLFAVCKSHVVWELYAEVQELHVSWISQN